MNDSLLMRSDERIGNLDSHLEQLLEFHGFLVEALLEGLAFQLLHHDEGMAGVVLDVVNDADIGMIQLRSGTSFALEALQSLVVFDERVGKEFEGYAATESSILRLVDDSHAAASQLA
jgi:hypothetical protein